MLLPEMQAANDSLLAQVPSRPVDRFEAATAFPAAEAVGREHNAIVDALIGKDGALNSKVGLAGNTSVCASSAPVCTLVLLRVQRERGVEGSELRSSCCGA